LDAQADIADINLQSLVDSHDRPFVVIDRNYTILAVNKAYEQAYGMARTWAVGKLCHEVSHGSTVPCHQNGEDCPHQHVFETGERCSCLHVHCDEHGNLHRVRVTAIPLQSGEGDLYLGELVEDLATSEAAEEDARQMVGKTPVFLDCLAQLGRAAATDAPVLLQGETGTGKELAASLIHRNSRRSEHAFLTLDCTVLTESLFEAEVFGHERGAFTGSVGEKQGLFELANGGTLFLDEIGEMPSGLQAKLLRVLEAGEFRRVGGHKVRHSDVRVVCATNRDLQEFIGQGKFREDLFYRIACLTIELPPLRDRLEDLPELVGTLLERIGRQNSRSYRLTNGALAGLQHYHYPGNVRELRNILMVATTESPDGRIDAARIRNVIQRAHHCHDSRHEMAREAAAVDTSQAAPAPVPRNLQELEAQHISELLQQHAGNRRCVADALGVSQRTLYRKLKRYALN